MNITAALSCPFIFVARGLRRLVTSSGSVMRYERVDSPWEKNGAKFSCFGARILKGKNPIGRRKPFTETPAQAYQRACDETSCFHIRKKYILGLSFRRFDYTVASGRSKNIAPLSFRVLEPFGMDHVDDKAASPVAAEKSQAEAPKVEAHLSTAPTGDAVDNKNETAAQPAGERVHAAVVHKVEEHLSMAPTGDVADNKNETATQHAGEPVHAALAPTLRRPASKPLPASKPRPFSHPGIFLKLFDEALRGLAEAESADLDRHLNRQERDLGNEKKTLIRQYKDRISRLFKEEIIGIAPDELSVTSQYEAYTLAERKTFQFYKDDQGDMGRFAKFMWDFDLKIVNATEFRFVRFEGENLRFHIPPVLELREPAIQNDGGAAPRVIGHTLKVNPT